MSEPANLGQAQLRVVRASEDPATNIKLYCDDLGFEIPYGFKDHDGFDAVILGSPTAVPI